MDYDHGTGHGVGAYLGVHEGPHGISFRLRPNEVALESGMLSSIEPGYYVSCPILPFVHNFKSWNSAALRMLSQTVCYVRNVTLRPCAMNMQVGGSYGIRIENIVRVCPMPGKGGMLQFYPLTLIPFQVFLRHLFPSAHPIRLICPGNHASCPVVFRVFANEHIWFSISELTRARPAWAR